MYNEILELAKFCDENGIEYQKTEFMGRITLRFKNGGIVVRSMASYGGRKGCVEFGYTGFSEVDFTATPFEKAKDFVKKNKDALNMKKKKRGVMKYETA